MGNAAKVCYIEDEENIRELVIYALGEQFECVGYECGADFFSSLSQGSVPDLILLDIMLPREDGLQVLKKIRADKRTEKTPVIMLTAKSGEYDKVKGLDLGADDYITKPFSVLELLSRVKAVLRRSMEDCVKDVIEYKNIQIDGRKRTVKFDGEAIALTYKEFELLHYLFINKGIVMSRDKLMEQIWGFDFEGQSRTVDMHIKTLRQKLGAGGDVIETVRGIGYKVGD